jgi:hypothetical protein
MAVAEEEAGKFLILFDAARCPRLWLGHHLKKFNDQLAKGIYADAYGWHAATCG